jgi:hypothetical protein
MSLVTRTPMALEIDRRDLTNRVNNYLYLGAEFTRPCLCEAN